MNDPAPADLRRAAMELLARREHSGRELARKLARRFPGRRELIEEEVARLAAEGLQSDARLAEAFIRAGSGKGQGPVKMRLELQGKGVSEPVIAAAFDECDVDWFVLAHRVAAKKFGEALAAANIREKGRVFRFLRQRGFAADHICALYREG